jgi:hypothetical protein
MDANLPAGEAIPSAPVMEVPSDPKAREDWLATGKLPAIKPANDGNAEPVKTSSSPDKGEGVPASETGEKEQGKTKSKAQQRLDEVLGDIKNAGFTPAELKTYKREVQQAKAVSETTVKPPERPKRPKLSEFYTEDDPQTAYETAMDGYESSVREFDRKETIAEFQRTQSQENSRRELAAKVNEAKTKYGEEAQAIISKTVDSILGDNQIPYAVKAVIEESPILTELLYGIGSKPEDLSSFMELARNQPGQALRQLALMENRLMEGAKAPKGEAVKEQPAVGDELPDRDEQGKFISRKVSKAPAPPIEIGGTKGTPPDEVETAIKAGDVGAYIARMNERDAARLIRR